MLTQKGSNFSLGNLDIKHHQFKIELVLSELN